MISVQQLAQSFFLSIRFRLSRRARTALEDVGLRVTQESLCASRGLRPAGAGRLLLLLGGMMAAGLVQTGEAQSQAGPVVGANTTGAPRFEVASIRSAPDPISVIDSGKVPHTGTKISGDTVDIGSATLLQLVSTAYSVKTNQVTGPEWMTSQRFDILAKLPAGAAQEQVPEMLRALLEERFKLMAHRSDKPQPVFALLVGPKGAKLKPSLPTSNGQGDQDKKDAKQPQGGFGGTSGRIGGVLRGRNGVQRVSVSDGMVHIEFDSVTTQALAQGLSPILGRPVIDRTGLQGTYAVTLDFAQSEMLGSTRGGAARSATGDSPDAATADPPVASVFQAIDKLGLKIESRKEPVEQLIVDHLEKTPTEN